MPFYIQIRHPRRGFKLEERLRAAESLLKLRKQLHTEIPAKTINDTLLLATWNLRNLTSRNRIKESYFYIAEIISAFDIVALQEIGDNLEPTEEVMDILGGSYKYIVTDTTEGNEGNKERLGFVYDTRKVSFQDIAGEVVLPKAELMKGGRQFARTPFLVAFQARWFKFVLCNVHILFGKSSKERPLEDRIAEIDAIAKFVVHRAKKRRTGEKKGYNYILLGDFNIVAPNHETMLPLKNAGFVIPKELEKPSTPSGVKHYDQIAFKPQPDELALGPGILLAHGKVKKEGVNAGVFDYYKSVFTNEDYSIYLDYFKERAGGKTDSELKNYYKRYWRTYQMSDHLPKWVELQIDFSDRYLEHRRDEITEEIKKKKK